MKIISPKNLFGVSPPAGFALVALLALAAILARAQTPESRPTAAAPAPAPAPAPLPTAEQNAAASDQLTAFAKKFAADTGLKLVVIAAGKFTMGDQISKPMHEVTISRPFLIGATDVTQAQWTAVMGDNPAHFKGDTRPVEMVSWEDAMRFCKKLTAQEQAAGRLPAGHVFTLPTSAQWEYACRAGTTGDFAGDVEAMGWFDKNSGNTTHPVATKQPNAWGLYDMHGNVWQWCLDWSGAVGEAAETDPTGPATGSNRVMRGGSWSVGSEYGRSAGRSGEDHNACFYYVGFRVAVAPAPAK